MRSAYLYEDGGYIEVGGLLVLFGDAVLPFGEGVALLLQFADGGGVLGPPAVVADAPVLGLELLEHPVHKVDNLSHTPHNDSFPCLIIFHGAQLQQSNIDSLNFFTEQYFYLVGKF